MMNRDGINIISNLIGDAVLKMQKDILDILLQYECDDAVVDDVYEYFTNLNINAVQNLTRIACIYDKKVAEYDEVRV